MTAMPAQRGRRRERLVVIWLGVSVVLLLTLVGACVAVALVPARPAPPLLIGSAEQFPPGSVTRLELPVEFRDPAPGMVGKAPFTNTIWSPLPVYIVHDAQSGFLAFLARDPRTGCLLSWQPNQLNGGAFIDPCHGSTYTPTGTYVRGPTRRSLDRFRVDLR